MADLSKRPLDAETFFNVMGGTMRTLATLSAGFAAMQKVVLEMEDFPRDLYLRYRQEILDSVEPALQRLENADAELFLELLRAFEGPIQ